MRIEVTKDIFNVAYNLSELRKYHFKNQFTTAKLKNQFGDNIELRQNVEGIIGYIGDMCCSKLLGLDPLNIMRNMILDTDLLTHRDECDLIYNGHRIDVKTEFFPPEKIKSVIERTITSTETYGCRLINGTQFKQNSSGIDIYFYGTLDHTDPRKVKYWYPIGWISKKKIISISPNPSLKSPAGAKLWSPAHCIPNNELEVIDKLIQIKHGNYIYYDNHENNPKYKELDKIKIHDIFKKSGL
jgi:hypothetical protein